MIVNRRSKNGLLEYFFSEGKGVGFGIDQNSQDHQEASYPSLEDQLNHHSHRVDPEGWRFPFIRRIDAR